MTPEEVRVYVKRSTSVRRRGGKNRIRHSADARVFQRNYHRS